MNNDDWINVKEIFLDALDHDPSDQAAFVVGRCAGNTAIQNEVESLLRSHYEGEDFIESPAVEVSEIFGQETSRIDQRFGNYTIEREIGHGGMGAVFLARRNDGEFDQKVAIKIVRQSIAEDHIIDRFKNERQILASLTHPNIAILLDGGVAESGEPFIVMEYVEGQPITDFVTDNELSLEKKLRLFVKVCGAVAYAHRNLVIHRDIKPGNILVTADGEPKLLDFGLAKITDENLFTDPSQTQTAFRALTPAYASPEQLKGVAVTTSSDVYSLGTVLFELLTRERPFRFDGKTLDQIIRTVTAVEPALPSRVTASTRALKGDLDNIILTALRNEPDRRYKSVEAFSDDIERYLDGRPVSARPNTFKYRTGKFIRRNKLTVATVTLVLFSLILGLAATLWQMRVAARERDQAQLEQHKSEQLSAFLQTILSSASPEESGKDAKVIEVLESSADRIDNEFADQPELRTQALLTIGRTFLQLSLIDKADEILQKAYELSSSIYGTENRTTAICMMHLGVVGMNKGRFGEAEKLLSDGIEIERRLSSAGSKELGYGLNALGEFYVRRGDYGKARALLQESVVVYNALYGVNNADSGFVLISLGRAQSFANDLDGAELTYRQALDVYKQLPPRYELRIALIKSNLGYLLVTKGSIDDGIVLILEAESTFVKAQGKSLNAFATKANLCRAYFYKNDFPSVISQGMLGIQMARDLKLDGTPDFLNILEYTGVSMTRTGDAPSGEKLLREALELATKNVPAEVAIAKSILGENLADQKRFTEAEPMLMDGYESLRMSQGEQSPGTLRAKRRLETFYELRRKNSTKN